MKTKVLENHSEPSGGTSGRADNAEHWTASITSRPSCANCGDPRIGDFCPQCGQKQLSERLKFWELVTNLFSRLTDIEAGLFHTFWSLCRNPGRVARDYVSGKQRPYTNPLTYFFIAATTQILAFWSVEDFVRAQLTSQMQTQFDQATNQEGYAKLEELLGSSVEASLVDSYVTAISQGYSYAALIFFAVPFALMLWLLHRAVGENFRLGETIVFALFTFSQMLLITACCTPFTIRVSNTLHMAMAIGTYVLIPQFAHGGFFARTWLSRLMTLISTLVAWIPFIASIIGIFLLSFIAKILWAAINR